VLELCQAACDMRGWQVAQGLPTASTDLICEHDDDRLGLQMGTSTDAMVLRIWELTRDLFESLEATIADGHLLETRQSDIGLGPLRECSTLIYLLVMLRLWCGVDRCCKYRVALDDRSKSGSVDFADIVPDTTLGRSIDDCCRRLSEFLPPHPLLASGMADLLSLGLQDAAFKWRHSTRTSSNQHSDRWWDTAVLTGVQPGGLLAGATAALHRAVDELAKEETLRSDADSGNSRAAASKLPSARTVAKLTGTTWMCIPAFAKLVKTTALTEPEVNLCHRDTVVR
jgi:hypothetical protein